MTDELSVKDHWLVNYWLVESLMILDHDQSRECAAMVGNVCMM